jgi:hypothetical protein
MQNKLNRILKNPSNFRGVFCLYLFFVSLLNYAQPQLKFTESKKSFGFVKKGEVVNIEFYFVNSGDKPLFITNANVECSCTTVNFPTQPIMPNEYAIITVHFDTKSVYDRQDRVVEIISNAKTPLQKIRFKGVVLK